MNFEAVEAAYYSKNKKEMTKLSDKSSRNIWLSFNILKKPTDVTMACLEACQARFGPSEGPFQVRPGAARRTQNDNGNAN